MRNVAHNETMEMYSDMIQYQAIMEKMVFLGKPDLFSNSSTSEWNNSKTGELTIMKQVAHALHESICN